MQTRSLPALALAAALLVNGCQSASPPRALRHEWNPQACRANTLTGATALQRSASAALRAALDEDRGAGVTAAVVIEGELVWSEALGRANDQGAPMTPAAQIRIGSVAKGFTAAMLARAYERGAINLDAPIQTYVPDFPRKDADISLRQLATHTSGVRQYDFGNLAEANNTHHYEALSDALALFAEDPLVSLPGQAVHYSSFGFNLAGVAVENIDGHSYGESLAELTRRLGLQSVVLDDARRATPCRPRFYTNFFGNIRRPTIWRDSSDFYPSGGLLATSEDLARFAYAIHATDAFSPEVRALFTQRATLANGERGPYAFAWEVRDDEAGNVLWYGLGGAANGAHASVRYYPAQRMAIAGAINYNFYLTEKRPAFFRAIREDIPRIFSATSSSVAR